MSEYHAEVSKWEQVKEIIFGASAIGLAICVYINLVLIWIFHKVQIYESNRAILIVELLLITTIIILGLERFWKDATVRAYIKKIIRK